MSENINTTPQPDNSQTPGETGGQAGEKLFTQADVNKFIQERLARERDKAKPDPAVERDRALTARENAMTCREYITEKGYPSVLSEIFDTTDAEQFQTKVEKLMAAFPDINPAVAREVPIAVRGCGSGLSGGRDIIAAAFKPR